MLRHGYIDGLSATFGDPPSPGRGVRPPILFVHGMFGGAWNFENYQTFFARRGYPSRAITLRGHGDSAPVPDVGKVSVRDYVADARNAVVALRAEFGTDPVICGHSMGGLITQKIAEEGDVAAAVLLCAAPPRGIPVVSTTLLPVMAKYAHRLLLWMPVRGTLEDEAVLMFNRIPRSQWQELHERMVPESGRAGLEMALGLIGVDARQVRCPMLSVGCAHDQFVVPRVAHKIAKKYGCEHREFADHAHSLMFEPGWEGPAATIADWIDSVVPSGTPATRG